jgi:hypothetical protein
MKLRLRSFLLSAIEIVAIYAIGSVTNAQIIQPANPNSGIDRSSSDTPAINSPDSKVPQCKNLIKVLNQTVKKTKRITNYGKNGDLQTISKLSAMFDKAARDLDAVKIDDEKLKVYQEQFSTMYKSGAEINKQIFNSLKKKKSNKVNDELRKSNSIFKPERDLIAGINQYCKEPEK